MGKIKSNILCQNNKKNNASEELKLQRKTTKKNEVKT